MGIEREMSRLMATIACMALVYVMVIFDTSVVQAFPAGEVDSGDSPSSWSDIFNQVRELRSTIREGRPGGALRFGKRSALQDRQERVANRLRFVIDRLNEN